MIASDRFAAGVAALVLATAGFAEAPRTLGVQARLEDSGGSPVTDPTSVTLRLWDAATGGALVHDEDHTGVPDDAGIFSVEMGAIPTDPLRLEDFGRPLWLGVSIDGGPELTPRRPLAAAPYALRASEAEGLVGGLTVHDVTGRGPPSTNASDLLTSTGDVGQYASITIGRDGLGVVSHHDATNGSLLVTHCEDIPCSTSTTTVVHSGAGNFGVGSSIALGTDGLPLVSYLDGTNSDVWIARCHDPACTTSTRSKVGDGGSGWFGERTALAVGSDGLPVVAYYDTDTTALELARCSNVDCTAASDLEVAAAGGGDPAIAVGDDGFPVIAYHADGQDIRVVHCTSLDCSTRDSYLVVDGSVDPVEPFMSITIGEDGIPVLAYTHGPGGADPSLWLARCSAADCSESGTRSLTPVGSPQIEHYPSVGIGRDGFPVVAYGDAVAGSLEFFRCGTRACGATGVTRTFVGQVSALGNRDFLLCEYGGRTLVVGEDLGTDDDTDDGADCPGDFGGAPGSSRSLEGGPSRGQFSSLTIGSDGNPLIAHYDSSAQDLRIFHCGNAACADNQRRR